MANQANNLEKGIGSLSSVCAHHALEMRHGDETCRDAATVVQGIEVYHGKICSERAILAACIAVLNSYYSKTSDLYSIDEKGLPAKVYVSDKAMQPIIAAALTV